MQSVNDRFRLADPNDPKRWRLSVPPKKDAPEAHKTIQAKLLAGIEKLALAGVVKCRADIEAALVKAGWVVSRRTKKFISVLHTRLKKPIRLNGRIFAADWNGTVAPDAIKKLAREWALARVARLRETSAAVVSLMESRANYNRKRFGGAHGPDPLLQVLIQVRDALPEPSPKDALAALHADLAVLKTRLGTGGTSLQKLGAHTRRKLATPEPSAPPTDQPTPIQGDMKL